MIKWFKRKKRKSEVDLDQEIEQLDTQEVETESPGDEELAGIAVSVTQEPAPMPEPESPPPAPDTQIEEGWQENLILAETEDQAIASNLRSNLKHCPNPRQRSPFPLKNVACLGG